MTTNSPSAICASTPWMTWSAPGPMPYQKLVTSRGRLRPAAFQRFDYDFVCAILLSIIALIMAGEVLATAVRAIFIDNATLGDVLRRRSTVPRERVLEDD